MQDAKMGHSVIRPRWWWVNPWRYAIRRDRAYADCLDCLLESQLDLARARGRLSVLDPKRPTPPQETP